MDCCEVIVISESTSSNSFHVSRGDGGGSQRGSGQDLKEESSMNHSKSFHEARAHMIGCINGVSANLSSLHFPLCLICRHHSFYFHATFTSSFPLITEILSVLMCRFPFLMFFFLPITANIELITISFLITSLAYLQGLLTVIFHHHFIKIHTVPETYLFAY